MPKILKDSEVGPGRVVWALALFEPEDPTLLKIVAASLAPKRNVAKQDLAMLAADAPEKLYIVVGIAYEYLRERLPGIVLVTGADRKPEA